MKETKKVNKDGYVILLEDKGQDFLKMIVDEAGFVTATTPFQTDVWKGSYVPIDMVEVGEQLPIHKPPNIIYGYLKCKVVGVYRCNEEKEVNNDT